jgi:DNA-binding transcriptional ArsR family regulator
VAADERRLSRSALKRRVRRMARDIADGIVALLDQHGMWDEPVRQRAPRSGQARVRRSVAALEEVCARVFGIVRRAREPVAISAIAGALRMKPREVAHPLALLVDEGKVVRSGERRGARYALAVRKTLRPSTTLRPPKTVRPPAKTVRPPKPRTTSARRGR